MNSRPCLLVLVLMGLWSCSSVPKREFADVQTAQWEASALVKDYVNRRSLVLNISGLTKRPDRMRIDATTSLGIHLMTMVVKDGMVEYLIPQNREYYFGPVSEHVLQPALSVDFHPNYLNTLIFDELPEGEDWGCQSENGFLKKCFNSKQKVEVEWLRRQGDRKTVEIKGEEFNIQMSLNTFDTKVEPPANSFDLTPPESFRKIQVK